MGDVTYRVDPNQVLDVAKAIIGDSSRMDDEIVHMHNALKTHVAEWFGEDQRQYEIKKKEWNDLITVMNTILTDRAAPALETMVENMLRTEINIASWWR